MANKSPRTGGLLKVRMSLIFEMNFKRFRNPGKFFA